uniref:BZIP domain-containing protein n=1 Tax=Tetranychus urticae TaxID=32264 RepID=T1JZD9_TETUR
MIDSNYPSSSIQTDMDLVPASLLYASSLDLLSSHHEVYDYGDFENQNNLNNINLTDLSFPDNQLVESDGPTLIPTETTISTSSSVSTCSSSFDHHYHRPLSTTSLDSLDASRSIDGCKRDLIKATLNFAIQSRRRSLGLGEIELSQAKNQDSRPSSWTDEADEKKISRRERNRIAARKCRKNRKLKFIALNKAKENLDNANTNLREELKKLKRETGQLEGLLTSHQSQCYLISWSFQPTLNSTESSWSSSPQLFYQSQSS